MFWKRTPCVWIVQYTLDYKEGEFSFEGHYRWYRQAKIMQWINTNVLSYGGTSSIYSYI